MVSNQDVTIIESPLLPIIADLVKNNKNLTPELQNAIARFISWESAPAMVMKLPDVQLPA
jgi:hypothetical protein